MPTLRQRFLLLAGQEPEQQRQYRRAWNWAQERLPDHVIHVEGSSVRLFPETRDDRGGFGFIKAAVGGEVWGVFRCRLLVCVLFRSPNALDGRLLFVG
jgi:hypothetical protein